MPIYEYSCSKCQTEFELMRPVSQMEEVAPCPKCGTPGKKLVSVFGSKVGFYVRAPAKPAFRKLPGEVQSPQPTKPKPAAKRKTKKG